ncbi:MAG: HU family DNA-binding protein [Chloroflexaceae bacterium]|nr:HU family DNA-binding protein [Chloroflexaceae bacterium]NJO07304.1 HU family DNA-binding protein [Chloroflexaceae bacterium]
MQKTEFIKEVATRTGMSQKDTRHIIDAAFEIVAETLAAGQKVTLTGFGTFEVRERQEREGVNPQTGQKMIIPATRTPGFTASSTLKERIKG